MNSSGTDRTEPADDVRSEGEQPSEQVQLAHRLEELFHGIQTTLFAQEMAAQQQLQSIADVWAATDRYRLAGHAQDLVSIPVPPDDPPSASAS
ncbi:MAG: proteasome activator [Dermatophilaceae bacterium]